jgi:hypothetical protein
VTASERWTERFSTLRLLGVAVPAAAFAAVGGQPSPEEVSEGSRRRSVPALGSRCSARSRASRCRAGAARRQSGDGSPRYDRRRSEPTVPFLMASVSERT